MTDEKVKILLCEDDENLGMLLREYLQTKGYDVDLQPDGEAGFKAFSRNKYDLCIFDVMMPKKDGFALAADVRSSNAAPIIFLTAKSMKEDTFQGSKLKGRSLIETIQHGRTTLSYRIYFTSQR